MNDASETLAVEDGLLALENSPEAIRTRTAPALPVVLANEFGLCALQRRSVRAVAAALARTSEVLETLRRIASEEAEVELVAALERAAQEHERLTIEKAERSEGQHAVEQMELLQAEVAAELHAPLEVDLAYFAEAKERDKTEIRQRHEDEAELRRAEELQQMAAHRHKEFEATERQAAARLAEAVAR